MIRTIKPIQYLLFLCLFALCGCQTESNVFIGEWEDAREPGNKWEITKSGSTFTGKRISGSDMYKYESEQWSYEIGTGGFPALVPKNEGGSSLIFQPKENRILRSPPGRAYVKVTKE